MEQPKDVDEIGNAGSCNVDVMCGSYQTEGRAVAKMVFTEGGRTLLCTGTLLNDTRNSLTPYFLTAAHCISSQEAASNLITYWFFRAESCGSAPRFDPNAVRMTGGTPGVDYYDLPNVPYSMFFYQGYAIHGTYWHTNFGHPMSHGCVNLPTAEAKWFYEWAPVGTPVVSHR